MVAVSEDHEGWVWALLLTLPVELAGWNPGVSWIMWDDVHWIAPLGADAPCFGTIETVQLHPAALTP
jgi:hypothetical protein